LRATDLLLQAGGFAAIVLDLGSTAPEHGARIPLPHGSLPPGSGSDALFPAGPGPGTARSIQCRGCPGMFCFERAGRQQTVLKSRAYQVRTGRVAAHPATLSIAGKRKPPAADWSAAGAWQREESA